MNDDRSPTFAASELSVFSESGGLTFLKWFSGALIIGGLLIAVVALIDDRATPRLIGALAIALGATTALMIRLGKAMQAVMTTLWGLMALIMWVGFAYSGVRAPALMLLPLICMTSGWLVGPKHGMITCAICLAGVTTLFWMQLEGHPFTEPVFINFPLVQVFSLVLATVLGTSSMASFQRQYERIVRLTEVLQDRVNELRQSEELLEARVQERTAKLDLALSQLKDTQHELVKSETLASLGSMVAGVSHELNTPIGNAVTVASSLQNSFTEFEGRVQAGNIKRSELNDFTTQGKAMSALIERSVQRAAELVASFKQVAVDQTSERRREFELHDMIEDLIASLRPNLKHQAWTLSVEIPPGIMCDSFPGPLGQILTNLIQNAAIHAFEGRDHGNVHVSAIAEGDFVQISVADDGVGMDPRTLAHAFDPFFTTRLGRGGSGLGLSICHRISNSILGGTLQAESVPAQGTRFTLRIPRVSPGRI